MDAAATPDGRQEQRQRATAVTFTSVLEEGGREGGRMRRRMAPEKTATSSEADRGEMPRRERERERERER